MLILKLKKVGITRSRQYWGQFRWYNFIKCSMQHAYSKSMTPIVLCKSNLQLARDVLFGTKKDLIEF